MREIAVERTAAAAADLAVMSVRDNPQSRLDLHHHIYAARAGNQRLLPYRRAAAAFMNWQFKRGVLNGMDDPSPGSPWWRAVNASLLRDTYEAHALALGRPGVPSSPAVSAGMEFIARPTARGWYRAHNMSVAQAYLTNQHLAQQEGRVERFFMNLVLIRVLYAHSLVAAPGLALNWLAPLGPVLGDPRMGMTGIFLSLSRVLPDRYPVGDRVERYTENEHGFGHLLDVGIITPRSELIFKWSAAELELPALADYLHEGVPTYAWDPADARVWRPKPTRLASLATYFVPTNGCTPTPAPCDTPPTAMTRSSTRSTPPHARSGFEHEARRAECGHPSEEPEAATPSTWRQAPTSH